MIKGWIHKQDFIIYEIMNQRWVKKTEERKQKIQEFVKWTHWTRLITGHEYLTGISIDIMSYLYVRDINKYTLYTYVYVYIHKDRYRYNKYIHLGDKINKFKTQHTWRNLRGQVIFCFLCQVTHFGCVCFAIGFEVWSSCGSLIRTCWRYECNLRKKKKELSGIEWTKYNKRKIRENVNRQN